MGCLLRGYAQVGHGRGCDEVSYESGMFLRNLYKAYGVPGSPVIRLPRTLVADQSDKFSIRTITEHAQACGFVVQARECARGRAQIRFQFYRGTERRSFVQWAKGGDVRVTGA